MLFDLSLPLCGRKASPVPGGFLSRFKVCVCVYVCLSVCLSAHAILAVRAIKSIMKDTIVLNVRFAAILKCVFLKIVLFES